jgi:shikimate kinase
VSAERTGERPLAQDEEGFTALLAAREPLYRQVATLVVETAGRGEDDVAAELATLLRDEAGTSARGESGSRAEGAA